MRWTYKQHLNMSIAICILIAIFLFGVNCSTGEDNTTYDGEMRVIEIRNISSHEELLEAARFILNTSMDEVALPSDISSYEELLEVARFILNTSVYEGARPSDSLAKSDYDNASTSIRAGETLFGVGSGAWIEDIELQVNASESDLAGSGQPYIPSSDLCPGIEIIPTEGDGEGAAFLVDVIGNIVGYLIPGKSGFIISMLDCEELGDGTLPPSQIPFPPTNEPEPDLIITIPPTDETGPDLIITNPPTGETEPTPSNTDPTSSGPNPTPNGVTPQGTHLKDDGSVIHA